MRILMFPVILFWTAINCAAQLPPIFADTPKQIAAAKTIAEFPVNTFLENVAVDKKGVLFVNSYEDGKVYRVTTAGAKSEFAQIPGKIAGIAFDKQGDLIISGVNSDRKAAVFRVDKTGKVETLAMIDDAIFLNGVTNLSGDKFLIADSYKGAESLQGLAASLGANAQAASIENAAQFGEIIFVAIPFGKYKTLPRDAFRSKIVIDAGNYYPQRDGQFAEIDTGKTTSSELVAAHLHGAKYVKGFNTIYFGHLAEQGDTNLPLEKRRAIFIAGDDSAAKETVAKLIAEIGFAAVDTGFLREGGKSQQPGAQIYNLDLTKSTALELLS